MTETLKPCPFCGGEAVLCKDDRNSSSVVCASCGVAVPFFPRLPENFGKHRDIQAVSAWNMRTLSALETEIRNELEECKEELLRAYEGDLKHTLETAKDIENLLRRVKAEMKGGNAHD